MNPEDTVRLNDYISDECPIIFREMAKMYKREIDPSASDDEAMKKIKDVFYEKFTEEKREEIRQREHELHVWQEILG